jgi:Spy/CpxP family protein refolding chaperone
MQALLNGITLTAEQQAKFDSIQTAFRAQMPAFTPGQAPDPAAMQQRREMMTRQDSTLRAVLTPEQQQVWDRNMEQARSMQRRPPGR